jgi:alanine dehydrogenase
MTVYLSSSEIAALGTSEVTMRAAWQAVRAEQAGATALPARLDVNLPNGFLRVMPAALDSVMGVKVMSLVRGVGNRYLLLLYSQESGELLAVLDASEITRLRTAAVTSVAGRLLCPHGTDVLAVVGSGFEAEGHLRALAAIWSLTRVRVFSPTIERREAFAQRMNEELGIEVEAVRTGAAAVEGAPVSVLATKSQVPVIDGACFERGSTVLSIGSTRPDLRELDSYAFARAAVVLADSPEQVCTESGDVIDAVASGALAPESIVAMADAGQDVLDSSADPRRDLRVFKSVGTALQDLALANEVLAAATKQSMGRTLGELTELKRSDDPRPAAPLVEGAP